MVEIRGWCVTAVLIAIGAAEAATQPVAVGIDATRTGPAITRLMFGGFMEPATTQVWAEILADRKSGPAGLAAAGQHHCVRIRSELALVWGGP